MVLRGDLMEVGTATASDLTAIMGLTLPQVEQLIEE